MSTFNYWSVSNYRPLYYFMQLCNFRSLVNFSQTAMADAGAESAADGREEEPRLEDNPATEAEEIDPNALDPNSSLDTSFEQSEQGDKPGEKKFCEPWLVSAERNLQKTVDAIAAAEKEIADKTARAESSEDPQTARERQRTLTTVQGLRKKLVHWTNLKPEQEARVQSWKI